MSGIAGPSSHTFPAFPAHPTQSTPHLTKLRRVQDVPDSPFASTPTPSTTPAGTPVLGGTVTFAIGPNGGAQTAPGTPIARSSSIATTDVREASQGPPLSVLSGPALNGAPPDPKASLVPDLDAVKARVAAQSRKRGRGVDDEEAMVQTAARYV